MKKVAKLLKKIGETTAIKNVKAVSIPANFYEPKIPQSLKDKIGK